MIKKSFLLLALSFYLCSIGEKLCAQETMIPDVSYVFLEKLISITKENYPKVKNYTIRTQIAKNNITRQQVSWLDAISLSYVYQPKTTFDIIKPSFLNGYQVAVGVNVSTFFKKPIDIRDAKEELKIAKNDEEEYNLLLDTEVKRRYFTYIQQLNNLKLLTKSLVDAESIQKDLRLKYERGEATLDQYSQGLITLTTTSQAKLVAESGLLIAKASLEELIMKKIEDVR